MADDIDRANDEAEKNLQDALNRAKANSTKIESTGYCIWCEEPVKKPKLFCCMECSKDYDENCRLQRFR